MNDRDERAFPSKMFETRHQGLTVRDYFAGQALARLADFPASASGAAEYARDIAMQAYALADAMLEARKR